MSTTTYRTTRRRLLAAASWNRWAHARGYSATAGEARRRNLVELAQLRQARKAA